MYVYLSRDPYSHEYLLSAVAIVSKGNKMSTNVKNGLYTRIVLNIGTADK